jgi:plastocyanin
VAENKKITELNPSIPLDGFAFVAATGVDNFRVSYSDIAEYSSIGVKSGSFTEFLTISGVPVSTGAGGTVGGKEVVGGDSENIDFGGTEPGDVRNINFQQGGENVMVIDGSGDVSIQNDLYVSGGISGDVISGKTGVFTESLTISGNSVLTGVSQDPAFEELEEKISSIIGGGVSTFAFFSNGVNNDGIIGKTYYPTPTSGTYLSGINVDFASDMTLSLRWDGPDDSYMGSGFIDGQQIPTGNIIQLGDYTRRFEGYISGLDLAGKTSITGVANGFTGVISLEEAGPGPTALHVTLDNIANAIPKPGENLGSSALKGADKINIFATFSTNDVTGIKVYDSGACNLIEYDNYSLLDTGDGNYTATIPVSINSLRSGPHTVSIVAKNAFGTAGDDTNSLNTVILDQTYPSISASSPASYNGRNDGLREGESTTFSNSISNWTASSSDSVLYSGLSDEITVSNSGTFEDPKSVAYNDGIFNESQNLNIYASRDYNGATDSSDIVIKIANGPIVNSLSIDNQAKTAAAPNIVGASEIKGEDVIEVFAEIDTKGELPNSIQVRVFNEGISNGSSFSTYSSTLVAGDVYRYTIPVTVTSSVARNGSQSVKIEARNQHGTLSDSKTSSNQITINQTAPVVSISSVVYPALNASTKNYTLTANGSSDYVFAGDATGNDPALNVNVGDTLVFQNDTGGHSLAIKDSGNSNVASQSGTSLTWTPTSAGTYTYYCVAHPNNMFGTITVAAAQGFQEAIKSSESAVVQNSVTGEDSVLYESPSVGGVTQLNISNSNTNESTKIVTYQAGDYNITADNFKVIATKTSNGAVTIKEETVNIANKALDLEVTSLSSSLESSANGISDNFNLNSDQKFLSIPVLSNDPSQSPASQLNSSSSGTDEQSNKYTITVKDVDQKGTFTWAVSAENLAGLITTTIATNPNYILEGFTARNVASNPTSALGRGLFPVGTTVSDPNNVVFENIAEGGSGPNGGTIYSYKSFSAGTQLVDSMDFNDQFAVCDSSGVTSSNGDFCYNLDKGIRDGNSSTQFPATADIKEE